MKRKKRANGQAYKKGYVQGLKGHSNSLCPFASDLTRRGEWLGGWRKGHSEYVSGFREGTAH
jgi:ribosome modulation factor